MDKDTARVVRKVLIAVSLVWIAGMGWLQFGTLDPDTVLTPHSAVVRDRMDNECTGSFQRRYDCKETIAIQTVRQSMTDMVMRLGIVVAVPALLALGFQTITNRSGENRPTRSFAAEAMSRRTYSGASSRPSPSHAAAEEEEVEEEEEEAPAATDDMSWKKSAQRHTQVRPPTTGSDQS